MGSGCGAFRIFIQWGHMRFCPTSRKKSCQMKLYQEMLLWVPFNFSYLENWFWYSIFLGGKLVNQSNVVQLKWLHEKSRFSRLTPYPIFIYAFSSLMGSKKFHLILPIDSDQNSDSWNRIIVIYLLTPNACCVFYAEVFYESVSHMHMLTKDSVQIKW